MVSVADEAQGIPKDKVAAGPVVTADPTVSIPVIVPHARRGAVLARVARDGPETVDQGEETREGKGTADLRGVAVPFPGVWRTSHLGVPP